MTGGPGQEDGRDQANRSVGAAGYTSPIASEFGGVRQVVLMHGLNDARIAHRSLPERRRGRLMEWDNACVLSLRSAVIAINRGTSPRVTLLPSGCRANPASSSPLRRTGICSSVSPATERTPCGRYGWGMAPSSMFSSARADDRCRPSRRP